MATVGPQHGKLILRTSRQGLAAQVGHDLVIEVTRWSGEVAETRVDITAETGSLTVLEGTGGALPLSERDEREIVRNARKILDVDRQPTARFVSNNITSSVIEGTLTLLGKERPLLLEVTDLGDGRYRGNGRVIQSEFGIKPYSAFLGALKVADPVTVDAEIDLSESQR